MSRPRIDPKPIDGSLSLTELVDGTFLAYNAARLREACQLFTRKMLADDVVVGVSLSGALTPAGLGVAALTPLIEHGFVDWIISTGANLYHDTHYALGLDMHQGSAIVDDIELRREGVVRIYDIFFDYNVLLETDAFYRTVIASEEFQRPMSTAEFHYRLGKYVCERERALGLGRRSLMAAAHVCGVPIYTSSPGDSSIGMNVAALALVDNQLAFDVSRDVNETAAIVLDAKQRSWRSAVLMLGGGSPKNFLLQTEPQIQEVLGLSEDGHDFFVQITDARPDTGGLSGATPGEAVSWGKVDPDALPDTVVCYTDTTIALPILAAYAIANRKPRPMKRLYDRLDSMLAELQRQYAAVLKPRH
ncbi:MAG: deoxyhypusine synthase [Acidobacteria bacterium RBG_16_68_9]|nr:MAG: deoxyhypusine synthase [Acidobacteria bacterium RBG_16_68_9]